MKKVHRSNAIDYRFLPFPSLIIDSRESRLLPVSIAFSIRSADEFRINSVIIILSEKRIGKRSSLPRSIFSLVRAKSRFS